MLHFLLLVKKSNKHVNQIKFDETQYSQSPISFTIKIMSTPFQNCDTHRYLNENVRRLQGQKLKEVEKLLGSRRRIKKSRGVDRLRTYVRTRDPEYLKGDAQPQTPQGRFEQFVNRILSNYTNLEIEKKKKSKRLC